MLDDYRRNRERLKCMAENLKFVGEINPALD